jgi:hypothetical protein
MTCFWDGIMKSLTQSDFNFIKEKKTNNVAFIKMLKKRRQLTTNVLWQGNPLREQEITEHIKAITEYDINEISNGHLTSVCDSFLLLICELFKVNIIHRYMNIEIKYTNKEQSRKTIHYSSNNGHFVCSR